MLVYVFLQCEWATEFVLEDCDENTFSVLSFVCMCVCGCDNDFQDSADTTVSAPQDQPLRRKHSATADKTPAAAAALRLMKILGLKIKCISKVTLASF